MNLTFIRSTAVLCLLFLPIGYAADSLHATHDEESTEHAHDEHQADKHAAHDTVITLTTSQMHHGGIDVKPLQPQVPDADLLVAGEVKQNGYTSYLVSPRVDSVVLKRHVALGEQVEVGQKLVTLFSEAMAQAQADYVDDYTDWQRIKGIGPGSVSDKRIKESQTAYHAAIGRLRAYGLSRRIIESLDVDSRNLGEYSLSAETHGTVLADDFNQGQRVRAGEEIMQIADESELWVEARLSPGNRIELAAGTQATVFFSDQQFTAEVVQEAHTIDPVTRTRIVRLLVNNSAHQLHPGMFVDVLLATTENMQLLVPEAALVRNAEGHWQVFVQQTANSFVASEVERITQHGNKVAISGIEAGTDIAMSGAFFIASQAAKGGFDPHNH